MATAASISKAKYNAKTYERIPLDVKKGVKELWRAKAEEEGYKSLNAYIVYCVEKNIK